MHKAWEPCEEGSLPLFASMSTEMLQEEFYIEGWYPFLRNPDFTSSCLYIVPVTISSIPVSPVTHFPVWRPGFTG